MSDGPVYSVQVEVPVDLSHPPRARLDGVPPKVKPTYQVVETENGREQVVARWSSRACATRDRRRFAERAAELYGKKP